jgi:hypothetical protein
VKPFQLEIMTKAGEERTVEFACMGVRENRPRHRDGGHPPRHHRPRRHRQAQEELHEVLEAVVERTTEIKETQRRLSSRSRTWPSGIDDDTGGHLQRIRYCKDPRRRVWADSKYKDSITENTAR